MRILRIKLLMVLPAVLAIAFLVSFDFFTEAKAACKTDSCMTGYINCLTFCENNNKTNKSKGICSVRCGDYWHDGASAKKGSDPTNPSGPPRNVGPGKLKNPPTTVSNPNSPTQPPEQIREKQKK
jgi:hypothetical protein